MGQLIQTPYRGDIDGLRTLAVLSVITYHLNSAWLPGGFVGVDVFFVISGYVVTSSLAGSRADSFLAFLSEFYARRLARILPALVAVLVFSAFMATLFIPNAWLSELSEGTARAAFFGLSNFVLQWSSDTYFAPRAEFNPYTHTWSLGVEEQYYVLAPLLVYFWLRAYRRNQAERVLIGSRILALMAAMSLGVCIWASSSRPAPAFYSIASRFWELGAGALLFLLTHGAAASFGAGFEKFLTARFHIKATTFTAWVGLICICIGFIGAQKAYFPWPWALFPVIGTLLLIGGACSTGPNDAVRRALAVPVMVWIGKRSYSLYLWHWPIFVLMRWTVGLSTTLNFAIALSTTFALSAFSYRMIELPLRHNPWIEGKPRRVRITGFIFLAVIGLLVTRYLFQNGMKYSLSTVVRSSADWYVSTRMPYAEIGERKCSVTIETHKVAGGLEKRYIPLHCHEKTVGKKIFVLGDSHAGMLAPMLELLSAEEGIQISIFSFAGCSFIDLQAPMDAPHRPPGCLAFSREVMQQTVDMASPGDIVILSSLRMRRYGDQWASFNLPDMYDAMYNSEAMKSRLAALDDARNWLRPFAEKKLKVIFTAPTPVFKAPPFRCSDWFNSANPICIGNNQQDRSELEKLRQPIVDSMKTLGLSFSNISVWDAFPILCPDTICKTQRDGHPLFFDGDHLSAYGNLVIYPDFKKVMISTLP